MDSNQLQEMVKQFNIRRAQWHLKALGEAETDKAAQGEIQESLKAILGYDDILIKTIEAEIGYSRDVDEDNTQNGNEDRVLVLKPVGPEHPEPGPKIEVAAAQDQDQDRIELRAEGPVKQQFLKLTPTGPEKGDTKASVSGGAVDEQLI